MTQQVVIDEHEMTPEMARQFQQYTHNMLWFSDNALSLGVYENYRGRYVAAAGGKLFVGNDAAEVEKLVSVEYPGESPYVQYIMKEKRSRIYAC